MKKNNEINERICPICNKKYTEPPALSRIDNSTPICPDCGSRQALESMGVSAEEQEQIIEIIHSHARERAD